ncbi:post-GPI attachment to proteins factor 6-like [Ornithodoros turicata]|uniref:post-GPI attachment to proteins factor 6-like n=1 Tax=Ornithodoros turicata TaxID=34597 RepID=UPI0031396305
MRRRRRRRGEKMANSCSVTGLLWFLLQTTHLSSSLVYTPSDAYQESLLRPFRAFSDVAIFHFTVPAQTSRAAWQFVAFMDDRSCVARPVHIYLRHGSYPVVSPDNSSFPPNVHTPGASHLRTESRFQPTEMPELHVINPLPGSWFVVAFLADLSHEIKQQGIRHNCQYSLGSMAAWTHEPNIFLLNAGSPFNITTPSQQYLFKVYAPDGTWQLEIKISSCTNLSSNHTSTGPLDVQHCVQMFGVRAQALPFAEDANTTGLRFSRVIHQPEAEVYYYIIVDSEKHMGYSITVEAKDCPTLWHLPHKSRRPRHLPGADDNVTMGNETTNKTNTLSAVTQLHEEKPETTVGAISGGSAPQAHFVKEILGEDSILAGMRGCLPVIPLTRIKHAQDFLDSFLVQGPEWFSSWLGLTDLFPVLVKLNLEPFVDIGGTLQTKIHLDSLAKNLTSQVVVVNICVHHARPPPFILGQVQCPADLSLTLSTNGSWMEAKYFPYPEPGTWFLSFTVSCYNHSGAPSPVHCELEQTIVDLRIRLQPCMFEGSPCGQHGYCQESHFRQFYFSSCHCVGGWRGWGCTDSRHATPAPMLLMKTLLLTLSNLFFLPAIVLATRRQFYTEAVVYGVTMFFSTFYHACDVEIFGFCLLRYEVLQFCDFFSAVLSFWVTLVAMAGLPPTLTSISHVLGALGVALGVQCQRTSLWVFVVPAAFGIALLMLSWTHHCCHRRSCYPSKRRWLTSLLPGTLLAATGLSLFAFVETEDNYKYIHSTWHIAISLSITFLLPAQQNHRVNCKGECGVSTVSQTAHDQQLVLNNDAELVDIADYRLDSDLTSLIRGLRT